MKDRVAYAASPSSRFLLWTRNPYLANGNAPKTSHRAAAISRTRFHFSLFKWLETIWMIQGWGIFKSQFKSDSLWFVSNSCRLLLCGSWSHSCWAKFAGRQSLASFVLHIQKCVCFKKLFLIKSFDLMAKITWAWDSAPHTLESNQSSLICDLALLLVTRLSVASYFALLRLGLFGSRRQVPVSKIFQVVMI